MEEDGDGNSRYTVRDLWHIAEAEDDDATVARAKRIAARMIVEMVKGSRQAREAAQPLARPVRWLRFIAPLRRSRTSDSLHITAIEHDCH